MLIDRGFPYNIRFIFATKFALFSINLFIFILIFDSFIFVFLIFHFLGKICDTLWRMETVRNKFYFYAHCVIDD